MSLKGTWKNECGSIMRLSQDEHGMVHGIYRSATGSTGRYYVLGAADLTILRLPEEGKRYRSRSSGDPLATIQPIPAGTGFQDSADKSCTAFGFIDPKASMDGCRYHALSLSVCWTGRAARR